MNKNSGRKLVVSLKSSSVELSVINLDARPEILFAEKDTLLYKDAMEANNFIIESFKSLQKLLKNNLQNITAALRGSHDCEVIFHAPWFLPELISEENKGQEVSLKNFFMNKVLPPKQKEYVQVENKITNILLNGYNLTKLRNIKSDDIEINIFRSYISKETDKQLSEVLNKELGQIKNIEFSTSTMEMYEIIKKLFVHEDNTIFMSIGGEVTEVGLIEDDILKKYTTFPIGSHMFSRELNTFISEKGNLDTLQFLSERATDETLDEVKNKKLNSVREKWENELGISFKEMGEEIPKKIFVFSNSNSVTFFSKILSESNLLKEKKIAFYPVTKNFFEGKVENSGNTISKNVEYLLSAYYLSIKN